MATARHLYCSLTKGSEIRLSSFILSQICSPDSPSWVYFCWCNPISISVFCQHLSWSMSHIVISLSNDYSATPLLLSPENVFSFFFSQHGYTESFTSIQVPVSFCSPILYFLYCHFILVMPPMLWLEISSSNFQHHLQILPSTKCWNTTQVKVSAFL